MKAKLTGSACLLLTFLLLFGIFFPQFANAQYGTRGIKYLEKIEGKDTYFVLERGLDEVNESLKTAVEKYWTFSNYKFIEAEKLQSVITDPNISFVRLINLEISRESAYNEGSDLFRYDFFNLALFPGGEKNFDKYSVYSMIAYTNIVAKPYMFNESIDEVDDFKRLQKVLAEQKATKAEFIRAVQSLNNYCDIVMKEKIKDNNNKDLVKYYQKQSKPIKNKTLLISKDDLTKKIPDLEAIKANYPHEVKVVENEEIWKAIEEQREDICYLLIFFENRNLKMKAIVQAKDSKVLYGEISTIFNGMFGIGKKTLNAMAK